MKTDHFQKIKASPLFRFFLMFLIISLAMSLMCFTIQIIKGLRFCVFCYLQRFTYLSVMFFSILGLLSPYKKTFRYLITSILFAGALIASYHAAIQYGWINDPCNSGIHIENVKSFETLIFKEPSSCSKIPWTLFGVSITIYNSIILWCLAVVSVFWKRKA